MRSNIQNAIAGIWVLCLAACASNAVSVQSSGMTGISFSPKRILVVGLMKNRADVTTDAFAATLADGFKSCGVVEESIFQESETPRLSLAKEDRMSLFWKKMREKKAEYKPDALLEITAISYTMKSEIFSKVLNSVNYSVRLTEFPSGGVVWGASLMLKDTSTDKGQAELASQIVGLLKKEGVLHDCSFDSTGAR